MRDHEEEVPATVVRRTGSETSTLVVWIAASLFLGALDAFVFWWTPGPGEFKSPLAVPVVTFFLLVALYVVFTGLMRRRLVSEMRGAAPAPTQGFDDRPLPEAGGPPPPLRVEISTTSQVLAASLQESPTAARARRVFDCSVAVHRNQVYLLAAAYAAVALVAVGLQQPLLLSGMPALLLLGAPLALSFLERRGRRAARLTIQYVAWLALHFVWVVATIAVAGRFGVAALSAAPGSGGGRGGALALVLLSALVLLFYARRVTAAGRRLRREVMAAPPVRLLFLWVFGDGQRIASLLSGIGAVWRCLGPLQFLQGGGMIGMGGDVFRHFRGHSILAPSDSDVDARIAAFAFQAHPWWSLYATNTLLCGDRSWRHALERLLDTDAVLMDLCGFSPVNAGCVYEIGQIMDRIPTSRCVFIVDQATDMEALRATLEAAWAAMGPGSPNRRPGCAAIRLFRCDPEVDSKGQPVVQNLKRNAECLTDLLCAGVDRGPAEAVSA